MSTKKIILGLFVILIFLSGKNAFAENQDFFDRENLIIYGRQNDSELAKKIKKEKKWSGKIISAKEIGETDLRENNLVLIGVREENKIIDYLSRTFSRNTFPLELTETGFTFNQKNYHQKNQGIAFLYPSPYNPQKLLLVYQANSFSGLENLIKNSARLNSKDYFILNENKILLEGNFNKGILGWSIADELSADNSFSENYQKSKYANLEIFWAKESYSQEKADELNKQINDFGLKLAKETGKTFIFPTQIYLLENILDLGENDPETIKIPLKKLDQLLWKELSRFYYKKITDLPDNNQIAEGFFKFSENLMTENTDREVSKIYLKNKIDLLENKIYKKNNRQMRVI